MTADDAQALADDAPIMGALIGAKERGARSTILAPRTSTAPKRTRSRSTLKNGDTEYVYPRSRSLPRDPHDPQRHVRGTLSRAQHRFRRLRGGRRRVLPVLNVEREQGRRRRAADDDRPRRSKRTDRRQRVRIPGRRRPTEPEDETMTSKTSASTRSIALIAVALGDRRPPCAADKPRPQDRRHRRVRFRRHLRPRRTQHRLGDDERPHRRDRRRARARTARRTLFVGAASGGVWKSTDGGTTFKPVFDKQPVQSIGAIAIDPSNHDTIWVGTGEVVDAQLASRSATASTSRPTAARPGRTCGLRESERIAKIIVDPHDGNTVYACVPGKLWSDSADRGLYKTTDGGKSWSLVLKGTNLSTGCSIDRDGSERSEHAVRRALGFPPQGLDVPLGRRSADAPSGSGLFRSTDGGTYVDRNHRRREQGLSEEAVRPYRGRGRAVGVERRLRVRRIDRFGAVPFGRRRQDLGQARQEPADGLAPVLLREPHRRSEESGSPLQARPQSDP